MKIKVIAVGKTREPFARLGIEHYEGRIRRLAPIVLLDVREEKHPAAGRSPAALSREAERILKQIPERALAVVLDGRGEARSSEGLAAWLAEAARRGAAEVAFVVGGPFGLHETVRRRASLVLTLSAMTFPHDLARLILLEQIYRALSILRDSPYHHGG